MQNKQPHRRKTTALFDRNTERPVEFFHFASAICFVRRSVVPSSSPRSPAVLPLVSQASFTHRNTFHRHTNTRQVFFPAEKKGATLLLGHYVFPDPCHLLSEVSRSSKPGQTEASLVSHWLETGKLHVLRTDRVWFERVDVASAL